MNQDILNDAEELLGRAVKVEEHRDWAIFWCPFHGDKTRDGQGGHANFGVHLTKGYWKCLRCGATGGSLKSLSTKLGKVPKGDANWKPPNADTVTRKPKRLPTQVDCLDEAMSDARSRIHHSPAMQYLASRGVSAYTALVYGLGYGMPVPVVHAAIIKAAKQSMMIRRDGNWLWAGSVVYADPPLRPTVINARYIPEDLLPPGTRNFTPPENHKTWGNRVQPLGAWRIRSTTRQIIVLEGLFDMLVTAQKIHNLGLDESVTAVYTNGASPAHRMLAWFREHSRYRYTLIHDPDKAGLEWCESVSGAIRHATSNLRIVSTPGTLDPDEAILSGWWPETL
jgi:DNA primase